MWSLRPLANKLKPPVPNSPLFCGLSALAVKGPCVCLGWFQAVPLGEQAGRQEHVRPLRGRVPDPLQGGTVQSTDRKPLTLCWLLCKGKQVERQERKKEGKSFIGTAWAEKPDVGWCQQQGQPLHNSSIVIVYVSVLKVNRVFV